jgi:hypothetical protein
VRRSTRCTRRVTPGETGFRRVIVETSNAVQGAPGAIHLSGQLEWMPATEVRDHAAPAALAYIMWAEEAGGESGELELRERERPANTRDGEQILPLRRECPAEGAHGDATPAQRHPWTQHHPVMHPYVWRCGGGSDSGPRTTGSAIGPGWGRAVQGRGGGGLGGGVWAVQVRSHEHATEGVGRTVRRLLASRQLAIAVALSATARAVDTACTWETLAGPLTGLLISAVQALACVAPGIQVSRPLPPPCVGRQVCARVDAPAPTTPRSTQTRRRTTACPGGRSCERDWRWPGSVRWCTGCHRILWVDALYSCVDQEAWVRGSGGQCSPSLCARRTGEP